MNELKMILRTTTVVIGIILYIGVWGSMIKNWDKCMRTGYAYPCFEDSLGKFYCFWITIHAVGVILALIWCWKC